MISLKLAKLLYRYTVGSRRSRWHGPLMSNEILFCKIRFHDKLANSSGCANAKKAFSFRGTCPGLDPSVAANRRIRRWKFVRRKSPRKITARRINRRILLAINTSRRRIFRHFIAFHHYALLIFMYVLHLQTCIVWFLSLFSEKLMCMRQNFKLLCCAADILNLIVSICLSCWPNVWCSGVFSAEFRSFRKIRLSRISAENMVQPAEFFEKSG